MIFQLRFLRGPFPIFMKIRLQDCEHRHLVTRVGHKNAGHMKRLTERYRGAQSKHRHGLNEIKKTNKGSRQSFGLLLAFRPTSSLRRGSRSGAFGFKFAFLHIVLGSRSFMFARYTALCEEETSLFAVLVHEAIIVAYRVDEDVRVGKKTHPFSLNLPRGTWKTHPLPALNCTPEMST